MAGSGPRRPHPPPSQPPAVARVTPLVPEVSLFLSGSSGGGGGGPRYGGWNNNYERVTSSKGPTAAPQANYAFQQQPAPSALNISNDLGARSQPPSPHQPLLQGILKPIPDFSRMFDNSLSLYDSGDNTSSPRPQLEPMPTGRAVAAHTQICFTDRVEGLLTTHIPLDNSHPMLLSTLESRDIHWPVASCSSEVPVRYQKPVIPTRDVWLSSPTTGTQVWDAATDATPPRHPAGGTVPEDSSPSLPPEILRVLNWQNEQLKLLQEQVRLLLDSSPHLNRSETQQQQQQQQQQQHHQLQQLQKNVAVVANETQTAGNVDGVRNEDNSRRVSTVATNTSSLWPEIQQGLARLHQIVEQEEEEGENSSNYGEINKENIPVDQSDGETLRSPPLSMHIDLPDYGDSECSPDLRQLTAGGRTVSWESPVLGESVSMYEEAAAVKDILSQVKRLLADPAPGQGTARPPVPRDTAFISRPPASAAAGPAVLDQPDPAAATLARLRQLGVSFISSEDLRPTPPANLPPHSDISSANPSPDNPYNSIFLPRAACLSQPSLWSNDASPDSSLEINSLALKYLDDAQLSKLAEQHRINNNNNKGARNGESRRGGERNNVDLSMATQEFLQRHGLVQRENVPVWREPLRMVNNHETPTSSGRDLVSRRPRLEQQLASRKRPPVNQVLDHTVQQQEHHQYPGWASPLQGPAARPPPP